MAGKEIAYAGKIRIKENPDAKLLLKLMKYLSDEQGFTIRKLETDEIKLTKNEFIKEREGEFEITKSNVKVEVEIEVSDNDIEIEVESENLELVKNLTSVIAAQL